MAALDTHKAFETFTRAGFSKPRAEALLETLGEEREAVETKADMQASEERMDVRFQAFAQQMEARFQVFAQQMEARLQALELRMTLRLGGLVVAAAVVLAILELIP
jgi:hypothetical protein